MGKFVNERIGILGGTFNPVHNGHLYIAGNAQKKLQLDKVIFIPTFISPHKKISGNASSVDRLHMLRLATYGNKRFEVSTYELRKKGKSYSIKTAKALRKKYAKEAKIYFLIGSDTLSGLKNWRDIAALHKLLQFVVVPRRGHNPKVRFKGIVYLKIRKKDISSTEIRNRISAGRSIRNLVPESVASYINRKKLYH